MDVRAGLAAAGFVDVTIEERPAWLERELAMWREAASLEPGDDPALRALRDEGVGILEMGPTRRMIAAATRRNLPLVTHAAGHVEFARDGNRSYGVRRKCGCGRSHGRGCRASNGSTPVHDGAGKARRRRCGGR